MLRILKLIGLATVIATVAFFLQLISANADDKAEPCKADAAKLCPGMKPGRGLFKCLREREAQLSPACKEKHAKGKKHASERAKERREACKEDVKKFCKDVKPGDGRIVECLKKNRESLSESCKSHHKKK